LTDHYQRRLQTYRYGPGVFKVDYALSGPIPWQASGCLRAATVHLGGSFEEIAASEKAVRSGQHPDRPFVLLAQPSLFDASRSPAGKHTAWAYCHVPNGSKVDMLGRLEDQIERFAPGFRECVLARRVFSTADLESMDANLVGGDIGGGAMDMGQFLFRPTWRYYATSAKDIYICSSSTPPEALLDWIYLTRQEGLTPPLDEINLQFLDLQKLRSYAARFPRTVNEVVSQLISPF
jgi:phytoene dehydrogenase-like protein